MLKTRARTGRQEAKAKSPAGPKLHQKNVGLKNSSPARPATSQSEESLRGPANRKLRRKEHLKTRAARPGGKPKNTTPETLVSGVASRKLKQKTAHLKNSSLVWASTGKNKKTRRLEMWNDCSGSAGNATPFGQQKAKIPAR